MPKPSAPVAYPVSRQNLYIPIAEALQLSSQLSLTAELIDGYKKDIPTPRKKLHEIHQLKSKLNRQSGSAIEHISMPVTIKRFLPI
jgi:hypothetical protein